MIVWGPPIWFGIPPSPYISYLLPPPSPVSPLLYDTLSGVKRGVNPSLQVCTIKNGIYVKKYFWKNFQKMKIFINKKYYEKNSKINRKGFNKNS